MEEHSESGPQARAPGEVAPGPAKGSQADLVAAPDAAQALPPVPLMPFQSFRIHRLLAGFLPGVLLFLLLLLGADLLWEMAGVEHSDALFALGLELFNCLCDIWLLCLVALMLRRRGLSVKAFLVRKPGMSLPACLGLGALLVTASFGLSLPLDLLMLAFKGSYNAGLPELWTDGDALALAYNLLSVVTTVVIAPLVEELVFRGIFLHRLTVKWNLRDAIVISSLIFGLLHGLDLSAFVFGLVMSLLYLESGSLRLTIAFHCLHNAVITWFGWLAATGQLRFSDGALLQVEVLCLVLSTCGLSYWFWVRQAAWSRLPPFLIAVTPAAPGSAERRTT